MIALQDKLEEFKQIGNYSVSLHYGEDTGCDDSDVPQIDRSLVVVGTPVGVLGSAKLMYYGTLQGFLNHNMKSRPTIIGNPPKDKEYKSGGYFLWGTEDAVAKIIENPFFGKWE
jgi:hypothetical protein